MHTRETPRHVPTKANYIPVGNDGHVFRFHSIALIHEILVAMDSASKHGKGSLVNEEIAGAIIGGHWYHRTRDLEVEDYRSFAGGLLEWGSLVVEDLVAGGYHRTEDTPGYPSLTTLTAALMPAVFNHAGVGEAKRKEATAFLPPPEDPGILKLSTLESPPVEATLTGTTPLDAPIVP